MKVEALNNFYLVESTALALWLGHRKSVDLDFFIQSNFDSQNVAQALEANFEVAYMETGRTWPVVLFQTLRLNLLHISIL